MIKVRFAPSPSGDLHVGNVRTALFNWLFAKKNNGKFVLRIEDTNKEESNQKNIDAIIDSLKWLGLDWDEGYGKENSNRYQQSLNFDKYKKYADILIEKNLAKWITDKDHPNPVLKFIVKKDEFINFNDGVRGEVSFSTNEIDDFSIMKHDGTPLYNLSVVIDDHEMEITDVIRGEDGISNTPRQILLYRAFGFNEPKFFHVSFILGQDGQKYSKSHGDTSIRQFKEKGYTPEAMLNYLYLLGIKRNGSSKETMNIDDMINGFSSNGFLKNPAIFDVNKLNFLNAYHIRTSNKIFDYSKHFINMKHSLIPDLNLAIDTIKGNCTFLTDIPTNLNIFCDDPICKLSEDQIKIITLLKNKIEYNRFPLNNDEAKELFKQSIKELNIEPKIFYETLKLALVNRESCPELFKIILVLGKDKTLIRLNNSIKEK
jgi:nondiscriminating glutamyl-tRNA synthetase